MKYIIYPNNLIKILDAHKGMLIPKKVSNKQKYFKLYHKYFCDELKSDSYFKIEDIYKVNDNDAYITLSFSDNIYWTIPNEIIKSEIYELIYDKNDILKQKIINSGKSYFGYEIIYWFYNKYNYRHSEFIPYIEDNGKCRLNESYKYFLNAEFKNGRYINIKIKLDRRRENEFIERFKKFNNSQKL